MFRFSTESDANAICACIVVLLIKKMLAIPVSTGAINAWIMAMHSVGDEQAAVDEMVDFWSTLEQKDVYKIWNVRAIDNWVSKSITTTYKIW